MEGHISNVRARPGPRGRHARLCVHDSAAAARASGKRPYAAAVPQIKRLYASGHTQLRLRAARTLRSRAGYCSGGGVARTRKI